MKFWLERETEFIYLDQLLKALEYFDNYQDIRDAINDRQVSVNGDVEIKRRKMLHEGDVIRFRGNHIVIAGRKAAVVKERRNQPAEVVFHGKTPKSWVEKPIKKS